MSHLKKLTLRKKNASAILKKKESKMSFYEFPVS